jgi:hypothetical protein
MRLLCRSVGDCFVTGKGSSPVRVELVSQSGHTGWIEPVDPSRSGRSLDHKSSVFQNLQMLRYRRPTHRKLIGQLAHCQRAARQALDYRPSRAIPENSPLVIVVSLHER